MSLVQLQVCAEERKAILRLHREASRVWPPRPPISLLSVPTWGDSPRHLGLARGRGSKSFGDPLASSPRDAVGGYRRKCSVSADENLFLVPTHPTLARYSPSTRLECLSLLWRPCQALSLCLSIGLGLAIGPLLATPKFWVDALRLYLLRTATAYCVCVLKISSFVGAV